MSCRVKFTRQSKGWGSSMISLWCTNLRSSWKTFSQSLALTSPNTVPKETPKALKIFRLVRVNIRSINCKSKFNSCKPVCMKVTRKSGSRSGWPSSQQILRFSTLTSLTENKLWSKPALQLLRKLTLWLSSHLKPCNWMALTNIRNTKWWPRATRWDINGSTLSS